ncbi:phage terminase, small subunit, putative, P27 [Nitrobacter winogradskyi Nb-255]|uniref:Phage terminase, small subunit, putative, P27 n=1 Tax=Nitrobacter winogradskyi (strain ATCC 25391 / DSM 10237 / CIP 104748 / NCIMB 11846 / Nb-255) TaxID=323098 RepID=Q3SS63_NITWN|nr:phage terminase small subunit P27 family [Nitrobacter winogradskyi]ABA04878.1 phage terminase, small subunit, putative, P27 [Nitrobacter winogradskyi Nb-255]
MKGAKPHLRTDAAAMKRAPTVPKWLSADAKREWKRVLPDLIERRILTDADLGSLENYCIAIGQVREMERILQTEGHVYGAESGLLKRHPAGVILSDAMTRARLLAVEMGLTPVSRSRPAIRDDDEEDSLLD